MKTKVTKETPKKKAVVKIEKPRQLQLIYDDILEKKQSQKELNAMYNDALKNTDEYNKLCEEAAVIAEKKKEIKEKIQNQLGRAWDQLEDIKYALDQDKERMNDEALNNLMAGVTVSVKDSYDNEYEPKWSVKFIKKQQ